jgi:hypothetical protein
MHPGRLQSALRLDELSANLVRRKPPAAYLYAIRHKVSITAGSKKRADQLLPHVHRVASLLKRWLLGTRQGAVSHDHLDYYLDEFTFRFNRRTSNGRGKLFYRLVQQAVQVAPKPYSAIVKKANRRTPPPTATG